jgi:enterochelin esterase-like enzyme
MKILKNFLLFTMVTMLPVSAFCSSREIRSESQTKVDSIKSEILKTTRKYSGYLPKSYYSHSEKRYPVLYLLHGLSDNNNGWLDGGNQKYISDHAIDAGDACEMIIIVPDAGRIKYGCFNTEGWPYESFFYNKFIPSVEKKYCMLSCQLRVRDGNHNWDYWQSSLYLALPFVSCGFGK